MVSTQFKTGMEFHINIFFKFITLILIINSCVFDKMDCKSVVQNRLGVDIYIGISAQNDSSERDAFISDFNFEMDGYKADPKLRRLNIIENNSKRRYCLNPAETKNTKGLYVFIFNVDSLYKSYNLNLSSKYFNDYHVLYYTIDHLDSIKWEITIDSLEIKKSTSFHDIL